MVGDGGLRAEPLVRGAAEKKLNFDNTKPL